MILIRVPAVPVAQPRQRQRLAKTSAGKSFVMNYTPTKAPVNDFKATVRMSAQQCYAGPPLIGPLRCDIVAVFPRTSAQIWKRRPMPRIPHTKKPDRDNLDKAILDSLSGIIWVDDCQVCDGHIQKWIASGDEQPHVVICVSQLEEC